MTATATRGSWHSRLTRPAPGLSSRQARDALGQRIVAPVVVADAVAQRPVAGGDAELLDPGCSSGGHGLAGELPAEPVVLLGQDDRAAGPQRGQRRGDAAEPAADDEDVCRICTT